MSPDWLQLVSQLGFPIAACVAMALGLWRAATWLGDNILVPIKDEHLRHLKVSEDTQGKLTDCVETIKDEISMMARKQDEHLDICKKSGQAFSSK